MRAHFVPTSNFNIRRRIANIVRAFDRLRYFNQQGLSGSFAKFTHSRFSGSLTEYFVSQGLGVTLSQLGRFFGFLRYDFRFFQVVQVTQFQTVNDGDLNAFNTELISQLLNDTSHQFHNQMERVRLRTRIRSRRLLGKGDRETHGHAPPPGLGPVLLGRFRCNKQRLIDLNRGDNKDLLRDLLFNRIDYFYNRINVLCTALYDDNIFVSILRIKSNTNRAILQDARTNTDTISKHGYNVSDNSHIIDYRNYNT